MEGLQDLVDEMDHLLQATPTQPGSRPAQHHRAPTEQQQQDRLGYNDSAGLTALCAATPALRLEFWHLQQRQCSGSDRFARRRHSGSAEQQYLFLLLSTDTNFCLSSFVLVDASDRHGQSNP
jgi:hypothetical protein